METLIAHIASETPAAGASHEVSGFLARALAFEMSERDGQPVAPEWVQIFPAGPELATVDGRSFRLDDPQAFVDAVGASAASPILVDYDHLSAFLPEENGDQTAAGWIEGLEVRDGQVWAKVSWTIRAAKQIAAREWRFVSPEFKAHKKTGQIVSLDALALVNRPAFEMKALASERGRNTGDTDMKAIAAALGLSEDATEEQILTAIRQKDAELETATASRATPSTNDFMPRADYDRVLARAEDAEKELKASRDEARKVEVDTMIASAVAAGKIAPASKDHYVNLAMASDAGFEEIKKLTDTLPEITAPSDLDARGSKSNGLTEEDKEMCAVLGLSEEDYAKQLAADRA